MADEETQKDGSTDEQPEQDTGNDEASQEEVSEDEMTGNPEQVKRLRQEKQELQEEVEETENEVQQDVQALKQEVSNLKFERRVDKYANGDDAKRKAIKQEFENYRPGDTSDEAIEERLEKANAIVSGSEDSPSATDGGTTSAGGATNTDTSETETTESGVSESVKEQGSKLGLDEDDYKEYGDQVSS